MNGAKIGYVRVSTNDQNTARQLDSEKLDRMFIDKASGKNSDRPQLQELLLYVRDQDEVIVHSMDRLARNLDDLRRLVSEFNAKGVKVRFVKEGLTFSGDDSAMSKLILSVMGAFAEFERSLILERQREGIDKAQKLGVYKGRKRALDKEQVKEIMERVNIRRENISALAREYKVSRQTIYTVLKRERAVSS